MAVANSNRKTKLVYGVGVNDADYCTQPRINGKQTECPFYRCWKAMITRGYSAKWKSRWVTYVGCSVCDEWHSFMAFRVWMQKQDWKGKELDKDLIGDGKLYSPENCVFVSRSLNVLFTDRSAKRGEYPLGVCWHKQHEKFSSNIMVNGKKKHLGYFDTAYEAHAAWLAAKLEIANSFLASETNSRVRYAIECRIAKMKTGTPCPNFEIESAKGAT